MKISAIKTYPSHRLVKIETDEGIYGWGEYGFSNMGLAVVGAIDHFREQLIGRDPMQPGALWQALYRSHYFEGGRVITSAMSAIDIALYDIVGKALGVPVYQLLGGKQRDAVPCFATIRATEKGRISAVGQALAEDGWDVIRLATSYNAETEEQPIFEPRPALAQTARTLTELRATLGDDVVLGVDLHHRLSVAEAASFCQRMPVGTLDFIEEPIRDETPEAYEALRQMTPIPFAIGEEFASKWQFLPYLERGIATFARMDICNVGGFTEGMKVAGLAEAHYIDLMPHNPLSPLCTAAIVHLASAVANFAWLEYLPYRHGHETSVMALFDNPPVIEGTAFPVPDRPGLGIDVDEAALANERFTISAPKILHRRDGSLTNW